MGKSNYALSSFLSENNIPYSICNDETVNNIKNKPNTIVVKSPGIPINSINIKNLLDKHYMVITDLELFYLLYQNITYICVTGTNGKTTTCNILNHLLSDKGFQMGGNMGIPLFSLKSCHNLIIEASSFMLDGIINFHPHIFIITNLKVHHLDSHGSYKNYYSSKFKPLKNMMDDDILIYNKEITEINEYIINKKFTIYTFSVTDKTASCYLDEGYIIYKGEKIFKPTLSVLSNQGLILDMMVGIIVAKIYNIPNDRIVSKLSTFKELEHRLEVIVDYEHLKIINDSKSTNPNATINAIECCHNLYKDFHIFLILGGKDGEEEYDILRNYLTMVSKIFIYGENRFIIYDSINNKESKIIIKASLDEVVDELFNDLSENTIVLFSPASSSKDQYESFEMRGKHFKSLINKKMNLSTFT